MDIQSYIMQGTDFMLNLPAEVQSGDLFAIMIALILLYCVIIILKKFTSLVAHGAKKIFILIIIVIASYIFLQDFLLRIVTEGLTPDNVIFGFAGLLCGILAVSIALYSTVRSIKKSHELKLREQAQLQEQLLKAEQAALAAQIYAAQGLEHAPSIFAGESGEKPPQSKAFKRFLNRLTSKKSGEKNIPVPAAIPEGTQVSDLPFMNIARDNSIGMVIIYLIIAEFGIFSSKTIAASSAETGFYFFIIFMAAAFIFIKLTYHNYIIGIKHFAVVSLLGLGLSIILGHFWGGIPLETLLSMQYFGSDALVALISGIALSLFMSNKAQ